MRILKSRRGVSPGLIVAILLVIVMGVAFSAYLWRITTGRVTQAILIQNVKFEDSQTIIHVQNVGEGPATLVNVYIDAERFVVDDNNCTVSGSNTNIIPKGGMAGITIDIGYTKEVHIKVVCSDGTSHESDYKPPPQPLYTSDRSKFDTLGT